MSKCAICIGFKNDAIITTECGHTFHKSCLETYIDSKMKTIDDINITELNCPCCRTENVMYSLITYPYTRNYRKMIENSLEPLNKLLTLLNIIDTNVYNYDIVLECERKLFHWYIMNSSILKFSNNFVNVCKYCLLNFLYVRIYSNNKFNPAYLDFQIIIMKKR
jgi:hypothetical protein